jgi:hypothetical protein
MKALFLLIAISLNYVYASAQDTIGLKRLVARFEVSLKSDGPEYGTGIILARKGDTLYLVTAGHVLRDHAPDKPIIVRLGDIPDTLHATVQFYHDPQNGDKEDLAVCSVFSKDYPYTEVSPLDTLRATVPVFYYHNRHLTAEYGDDGQSLITWSKTAHTYKVYMPDVAGGDSGGPVFTRWVTPYLAGIIISGDRSCEVLRISQILDIIKKEIPSLTL